jgi:predicted nucleic acid-binding protein
LAEFRKLPLHHRDPFDRLLVAQSKAEGIPLVTCDPKIAKYGTAIVRNYMESGFLAGERFQRLELDFGRIFLATMRLIPSVTASTGCRTLDLLHIATAQVCGASGFVTGDARQAKAARLCGLDVVEIC